MASINEQKPSNVYLVDYFIYWPVLCKKEGQEREKILYYYPSHTDINYQIRTIGYCEGLVKFTETFAFDHPCEAVHFQKTRLLFYKVENDICFGMTLCVPMIEHRKDDRSTIEYQGGQINDRLILRILKMSYEYFVLQHGTLLALNQHGTMDELKEILKNFFDKFIKYRLQTIISNITAIDSSYFGLQFLFIDKNKSLTIQSILRRFELHFTSLKETLLLCGQQLVWSGLNQDDTNLIYTFFRLYYWPKIKATLDSSTIRYLVIDMNAEEADELIITTDLTSQEVYFGNPVISHQILVINFNLFTLFCVFHDDAQLCGNPQIVRRIENLRNHLNGTLFDLEGSAQKAPIVDAVVRNIYFNKMNTLYSSTTDQDRESNQTNISLVNTLVEDLRWFHPSSKILVKNEGDPWFVAKRSNMRELLLSINLKSASLTEIRGKTI